VAGCHSGDLIAESHLDPASDPEVSQAMEDDAGPLAAVIQRPVAVGNSASPLLRGFSGGSASLMATPSGSSRRRSTSWA